MKHTTPEIVNRKAYHDFFIGSSLECGIELKGHEIKSIREGQVNIKDAWCDIENNQLFINNMHIKAYRTVNAFDVDEIRPKRLLAHKSEIRKLASASQETGYTLIPLKLYFVDNRCKLLIGLCKGKKLYDKRNALKEKQMNKDIHRAIKDKNRGDKLCM